MSTSPGGLFGESGQVDAEPSGSALAGLLAGMPDLWVRVLGQHSPDAAGRCLECRTARSAAIWPCLMNRIAAESRQIFESADPPEHPRVSAEVVEDFQEVARLIVDRLDLIRSPAFGHDDAADRHVLFDAVG